MQRQVWSMILAGFVLMSGSARGDEKYTIQLMKAGKGTIGEESKEEKTAMKMIISGPDGKVLNERNEETKEIVKFTEETLEREAKKKPTKLRRTYEKAQILEKGKTSTLPYEGKAVLIERKGDKYVFTIEGGKDLTGGDARLLAKEFNKDKDDQKEFDELMLPKGPVALNEAWKIDADEIVKQFVKEQMDVDKEKVKARGKLVKAYKKDGIQFGVMEFDLELPVIAIGKGEQKVKMDEKTKLLIKVSLDACIDGQQDAGEMKGTFNLDGTGVITGPDGKDYKMVMKTDITETTKRVDKGKK